MANGRWLSVRNSFLLFITLTVLIVFFRVYYSGIKFKSDIADKQKLSSGDIIFRKGTSFWSPFFSTLNSQTGYSHVGVIVKDRGELYVIHSDSDDLAINGGVQKTILNQFIEESSLVKFMNNKMTPDVKNKFLKNIGYSLEKKVPFDDDFDIHDNGEKLYCTELLWRSALNSGGKLGDVEIIAGKELITVDSIYSSDVLSNF